MHHEILKEYRQVEFTKKLEKARATRSKGYEYMILKAGDVVYYQNQGKKAWLGPEKVFAVKNKDIFLIANGSIKKIPRSNIQFISRDEPDDDETTPKEKEKDPIVENSVSFDIEEEKEASVIDNDQASPDAFGENLNSNDIRELEAERRQTRSRTAIERRELTRDQTAAFWLQMENTECYDDIAVFAVEVPTKEHKKPEVLEAKD